MTPVAARVGEGVTVELSLAGEGNTALWPAPAMRWPPGARAYSDKVEERVGATEGRIGGTKTFRYLVVPDSVGALALPAVSYVYFDLASNRYLTAAVPAASVPVAAGGEATASTALPPAILRGGSPSLAWRLGHGVPDWVWLLVLLAPPTALALRGRWSLPRRRPSRRPAGDLKSAEEELDAVVRTLVPDPHRRSGAGLAAAVRAAGADAALAGRVAAARERLLARRYGPTAGGPDDAALTAEVRELVRSLGGSLRGWAGRGAAVVPLVAAALVRGDRWRRHPRPRRCTRRARSAPRPKDSPTGPSASRRSPRTGTISAPRTTGWARTAAHGRRGSRHVAWRRARPPSPRRFA